MKIFFAIAVALSLFNCSKHEKEKARLAIVHSQKKLTAYNETVDLLNQDLKKLEQQFEMAEDNIIINLVKEFRIYRTKKEREQRIKNAVAQKEGVEDDLEKTILKINHLTDSVKQTEKKIREAKAAFND